MIFINFELLSELYLNDFQNNFQNDFQNYFWNDFQNHLQGLLEWLDLAPDLEFKINQEED